MFGMSKQSAIVLLCALVLSAIPMSPASATETFPWGGDILSGGATLSSPALTAGREYRIKVREIFWYNKPANLAADAMYYTTSGANDWQWVNHKHAPGGHSFVQINGMDVNWGPFSNGDTGHTYSIIYTGAGVPLTFQIVDWIDGVYSNNDCHLPVVIYELPCAWGGKVTGGGQCIVEDNERIPSASFGFNAMWFSRDPYPKGELNYVDHITGMHVHIHDLTYLEVWEDLPGNKPWPLKKAIFGGPCTIDGEEGFFADVYVEDNGEPGTKDKFQITLSTGYVGGSDTAAMLVGNIQIHIPPK